MQRAQDLSIALSLDGSPVVLCGPVEFFTLEGFVPSLVLVGPGCHDLGDAVSQRPRFVDQESRGPFPQVLRSIHIITNALQCLLVLAQIK